jgi:SAM-dependent methyltransferase
MTLYADPRVVDDPSQCVFYHAMDLPGGAVAPGNWDLRGRFEEYTANVDFLGKRVLDVGTASGFLTFEAEKRGAEVVSFDSSSPEMHIGLPYLEVRRRGKSNPDAAKMFEPLRNGYWYAHRAYSSKARCHYGDIYDLPEALGEFDIALVGQILVHLRDPIGALTSIARRCRNQLVITEGIYASDHPAALFLGHHGDSQQNTYNTWWHYSPGLYRNILEILGFKLFHFKMGNYLWKSPEGLERVYQLGTIGAVRVEPVI